MCVCVCLVGFACLFYRILGVCGFGVFRIDSCQDANVLGGLGALRCLGLTTSHHAARLVLVVWGFGFRV